MSSTLKDLADAAAAEASPEKKEAEVLDDEVDDDGCPDPDYDSHGYIWFNEERKLFQSKGVCAAYKYCCLKDLEGGFPAPPATSRCRMCGFAEHRSCLVSFEPQLEEEQRELHVCKYCLKRNSFNTVPYRRSVKVANDDHATKLISKMYRFSYSLELVTPAKFKSICDDIDDWLFDESAKNGKLRGIGCLIFMYPVSNY
jgi:hypothetical protein